MLSRLALFGALVFSPVLRADATRAATEGEVALLTQALQKTADDLTHWAYTESRVLRDENGKLKKQEVVRFDPSKPYAEQWTPVSVNGKPPAEKDREKYRKQGERSGRLAENPSSDRRLTLGEVIEPNRARVVSANERQLVFEIPLRKDRNNRFPPEKFEVLARISRETSAVENIAVRLRESFRVKLVAKIKSGEGTLDFAAVDPKFAPTLTAIRGDASVSIFFISVGGEFELKRTELKHVKPYAERFEVQIGTLKAIDF
jgi:hypothetical protein